MLLSSWSLSVTCYERQRLISVYPQNLFVFLSALLIGLDITVFCHYGMVLSMDRSIMRQNGSFHYETMTAWIVPLWDYDIMEHSIMRPWQHGAFHYETMTAWIIPLWDHDRMDHSIMRLWQHGSFHYETMTAWIVPLSDYDIGVNHVVDTVQCFLLYFLIKESNQFKAPKFIIILYVVK